MTTRNASLQETKPERHCEEARRGNLINPTVIARNEAICPIIAQNTIPTIQPTDCHAFFLLKKLAMTKQNKTWEQASAY